MLQTTLRQIMKKQGTASSNGQSLSQLAAQVLVDITSETSSAASGVVKEQDSVESASRRILDSKSDMASAKDWLSQNNIDRVSSQPAFVKFLANAKALTCTCADDSEWDPVDNRCAFHHECSHTLVDLLWGFAECLDSDPSVLPESVRMVGTAALTSTIVLKAKIAEHEADKEKDKDTPKPTLSDVVGPLGTFMFEDKTDETDGVNDKALNENLLSSMISVRASYVLNILQIMINVPSAPSASACGKHKLI